ncbi:MAG: RNA polymerase sigma-70 factor [Saprospiraceae bacterium]
MQHPSPLTAPQEKALLERLRQDDERAFRQLFDQYYHYLTVTAFRYLNDVDKARDFAQDTFVELWNRRTTLVIQSQLKSYLRRAVVNKSLTYLKREKRIDFAEHADLPETPVVPIAPEELAAEELQTTIQRTIAALPNRCRVIFQMSRFEEKSHKEIAAALGISTKTIENQMTKALKALRRAVQKHQILLIAYFFATSIGEYLPLLVR